VDIQPFDRGFRAVVALSEPLAPRVFILPAPQPRIVIDLPAARVDLARGARPASALVTGVRAAQFDVNTARVVLDLSQPATVVRRVVEISDTGEARLVVDLVLDGAPSALEPAPKGKAQRPLLAKGAEKAELTSLPVASRREWGKRTIVIDAGHGGKDPGALGRNLGVHEKDITLAAALSLRQLLEARGYNVVLTRDADVYLLLPERVSRARAAEADLFISLHADSSPNAAASGASIYTLSEQGGQRAKAMADKQNWDLELAKPAKSTQVETILMDLAQRDTKNRSANFAQTVIEHLAPVSPLLRNTHRSAGFFVLLAPDVPAILLEMGFLTNAQDEARLADPKARKAAMTALADAVDVHFAQSTVFAEAQ
jgi:N-acetylmuramoyl-L-alanine amidase